VAAFRIRAKTLTDPTNTPDQLRSTSLAHRRAAATILRSAVATFRQRAYGRALRQVLNAFALYQAYFRARLATRMRRLGQNPSRTGRRPLAR
jgi:hypothetical protein